MPPDARISVTLPTHPKTKKLLRRHGPEAAWGLVCLFLWAAGNRSDGSLAGMTNEDIELAADWTGEANVFVKLLVDVGYLDGSEGSYAIHDWAQHNPWAAGAEDRSTASKWAALCKRYGREIAAERMPEYAARMRPAHEPDAEPVRDGCPATASVTVSESIPPKPPKRGRDYSPEFQELVAAYPRRQGTNPLPRAWKAFNAAIDRGATHAQLIEAARAYARTEVAGTKFCQQLATWLNGDEWKNLDVTPKAPEMLDETAMWRIRVSGWTSSPKPPDQRFWLHDWGPPPHKNNPKIPAAIIAEFNLDGLTPPDRMRRTA